MGFYSHGALTKLARPRSAIVNCSYTLLLFGAAFGVRLLFHSWLEPNKFVTFYPAIAAATLVGGGLHGCAVLGLSVFFTWCFLFEPTGSFALFEQNQASLLIAFALVGGFLILIVVALRDVVRSLDREVALRRLNEERTLAAKAEAERANLAKSKFLAAASHDLRQPVQALAMLTAALKRQAGNAVFVIDAVDMMQRSLDGLNTLLNGVLDVSRLDAGAVVPNLLPVDLQSAVSRLAQEYVPAANSKRLTLRVDCAEALWSTSDPALLERILRNLVENALRYTREGGVLLKLWNDRGLARIDIIDTGLGIPADKKREIFEEFSQLDNPARDAGRGLGLGLAIVERLAMLLGAEVRVWSKPGLGTCFSLFLPLDQSKPPSSSTLAEHDERLGGKILVIEDNAIVRAGYEMMLGAWGFEVKAACTGEEAVEIGKRERFDVIIADHRLGAGLTGTAAASEIAAQARRRIPTLVLTGDTAEERIAEVMESGFRLLHKPIAATELQRELACLMDSQESAAAGAGAP
jgi:two-component system, sensor histidine kinase and response regulator